MDGVTQTNKRASGECLNLNNGHQKHSGQSQGKPSAQRGVALCYPFFFYNNFSQEEDEDPLKPLTPVARVPNFPAKMHAILAREELSEIVSWLPHGRAWKIFKPREFEINVLPIYFNHCKLSSFIRQANGWGFRRISQGADKNAYYHELFLRGLPHLCKKLRRPGVNQKNHMRPEYEPDLHEISRLYPVPKNPSSDDDSILLKFTVSGGPKARVPVELFTSSVCNVETAETAETVETAQEVAVQEKLPDGPDESNVSDCITSSNDISCKAVKTEDAKTSSKSEGTSAISSYEKHKNDLDTTQLSDGTVFQFSQNLCPQQNSCSSLPHFQQTGVSAGVPTVVEKHETVNPLIFLQNQQKIEEMSGLQTMALACSYLHGAVAPIPNFVPGFASYFNGGPTLEQFLAYQLLHQQLQK